MMNREECENKILEKLKEVRTIFREYDKSDKAHLSMCIIGDNYITTFNDASNNPSKEFPLDVTLMDEGVYHFGD